MIQNSIYDYIRSEETNYSHPVKIVENWEWNMKEHIATTILYKNSTYITGKDDNKPFKNIIRPILNLQYRAEGFDVKDIELYVNSQKNYYKSFLIKKYHEKWAREHAIDTFIDELVESYVDFGGTLVKKTKNSVPEVIAMSSIAFCDQTDILSGPICIRHSYSPDKLKDMEDVGWGDEKNGATISVSDLITIACKQNEEKAVDPVKGRTAKTPGKYIEIYELHGNMPKKFLDDDAEEYEYVNQFQIVAFYKGEKDNFVGCTLYAKKEDESPFKLLLRDKISGRALGLGGAEELFEPQVWVNYDVIQRKEMLDFASKVILQTDDQSFSNRNKLSDMDNGEIAVVAEGKKLSQIDTFPRNMNLFDRSVVEWEQHAQQMGSAQDAIMGEQPKSGTPFRLQELVTSESHSLHEYRKGKIATFLDEVYQDWIIPYIAKEVANEQEFLAELTLREMQEIRESIALNLAEHFIKKQILSGKMIIPEEVETIKENAKTEFMRLGNKRFIKILAKELKDSPISVKVNIAGKQEYLSQKVDKLVNVFRQIISAPQILQQAPMAELFNQIIESSGLSPIDFSGMKAIPQVQNQITNNQAELPAGLPA